MKNKIWCVIWYLATRYIYSILRRYQLQIWRLILLFHINTFTVSGKSQIGVIKLMISQKKQIIDLFDEKGDVLASSFKQYIVGVSELDKESLLSSARTYNSMLYIYT